MKLKELRLQSNLTQRDMCNKFNISLATYNDYETKNAKPRIKLLKEFANYFNVSLDYLCENEKGFILPPLEDSQKKAINIILNLPEKEFYMELGRLKTLEEELNL